MVASLESCATLQTLIRLLDGRRCAQATNYSLRRRHGNWSHLLQQDVDERALPTKKLRKWTMSAFWLHTARSARAFPRRYHPLSCGEAPRKTSMAEPMLVSVLAFFPAPVCTCAAAPLKSALTNVSSGVNEG